MGWEIKEEANFSVLFLDKKAWFLVQELCLKKFKLLWNIVVFLRFDEFKEKSIVW
jgi:hypothetical protein